MVVFLINGRCYHSVDWIRAVERNAPNLKLIIITDLKESEGYQKLLTSEDLTLDLINVDKLMFKKTSKTGNLWRNLVRFLLLPIQAMKLRNLLKTHDLHNATFHAHTMYYIVLAWLSRIKVIATPQGSEILVRPHQSKLYKLLARMALKYAKKITVDSREMQNAIQEMLPNVNKCIIAQNGIQISKITSLKTQLLHRKGIVSFRGFTPLYQIKNFMEQLNKLEIKEECTFIYPFCDFPYKKNVLAQLNSKTTAYRDMGRVNLEDMVKLFSMCTLAISIPISDSSPRSVYEAIFSGAIVATTDLGWLKQLPDCMFKRVIIVDINANDWLKTAYLEAKKKSQTLYSPSKEAIDLFDEDTRIRLFFKEHYI